MNQEPSVPPTSTAIRPSRPVARPDALRETEKPSCVGGRPDARRGRRGHQVGAAQRARHGGHRDAGAGGHVGHRGERLGHGDAVLLQAWDRSVWSG